MNQQLALETTPNDLRIETPEVMERFMVKVDRAAAGGCWLWLSDRNLKNGRPSYGRFRLRGVSELAHRFAYEAFVGYIPEGMVIDHLCRNQGCVNPEHLEAVTPRENSLRGDSPPAANARKTHCPKGHPLVEGNLDAGELRQGRRCCLTCKRDRGRRYWRLKNWGHEGDVEQARVAA